MIPRKNGISDVYLTRREQLHTEHLAAHVFLMRTACQIVIVTHFTSCLAQVQDEALCVVRNSSHHRAACRTLHLLMSGTSSPGACTTSFTKTRPTSTFSNFFSGEIHPCHDPQQVSIGYLADPTTFTTTELHFAKRPYLVALCTILKCAVGVPHH